MAGAAKNSEHYCYICLKKYDADKLVGLHWKEVVEQISKEQDNIDCEEDGEEEEDDEEYYQNRFKKERRCESNWGEDMDEEEQEDDEKMKEEECVSDLEIEAEAVCAKYSNDGMWHISQNEEI